MKIKFFILSAVFISICSVASSAYAPGADIFDDGRPGFSRIPNLFDCPAVKRAGKRQIKSQSFPFNFAPFNDACFVTFGSTEQMLDEKDLPRGSTFHLYRSGESLLDLPDAFDGLEACWVEGVAFKDLNADGLTDIIIAGSCLGARDSYPQNAVFVNNGQDFTTNSKANEKLENLTKLSAIEAFVKRNKSLFF